MLKMTLHAILEKFAVKLDRNDPEFPQDIHRHLGSFGYNNGTLAVVTPEGECYVIRMSIFSDRPIDGGTMPLEIVSEWVEAYGNGRIIYEALHVAGYEETGLWVPHSNDAGTWIRSHMPVTQGQLFAQMVEAKRTEEVAARLDRIATATATQNAS